MGSLIGSILCLYLISLLVSMVLAFFRFIADVKKWHDKEEKVHITPSQFEADIYEVVEISDRKEGEGVNDNDTGC